MKRSPKFTAAAIASAAGLLAVAVVPAALATPKASIAAATAHTDARLLPRADLHQAAWSPTVDNYRRDYVYPAGRRLRLAGCASTIDGVPAAKSTAPGPSWQLEPLDAPTLPTIAVAAKVGTCARTVTLPALGRWRITTAVRDAAGAVAIETQVVSLRDLVVAAVGDSFASGEGNKLDGWVDAECHRSHEAWPQRLARSLEDASTTVTFLSFACTGAGIEHVAFKNYAGVGGGQANLRPQLRALRSALGDPLQPATRPVDVLLGAAGINALSVGRILSECSIAHPITRCRRDLSAPLATLPPLYDRLELALSENIRLGAAYFAGYPARIFTDGEDEYDDCGVFAVMDTPEDDEWVDRQVSAVNTRLARGAVRHGWTAVQTRDLFRRHGYCADSATWFRTRQSSQHGQGDDMGTAHPNLQGHDAIYRQVRQAVGDVIPAPTPDVFDVRFLRVRVTDDLNVPWPGFLSVGLHSGIRSGCGHEQETAEGLRLGVWNDLSANPCLRYHVRTAGRTVLLSAWTFVNPRKGHDNPPQDEQAGQGQPTSPRPGPVTFSFDRFLRRSSGWNATPTIGPGHVVQRFTDRRSGARVELEYEITRPVVAAPSR